ncbi:ribosome small subunit-dependent GTPase A [Micromonospora sp. NBC_01813]|uniref:ribosome small subunit-dependent GTPase A n=1 Tax=Micromonospora sp. NBC_01813 TaxID=2975988 RepID=UPI002DDB33B1|nr:ribosome small subunit-dependent GTPase A [Micromonospora sp. NBC_01813]WSA12667.1 ribosome small subunit-dependent GTPase A [Micromonospora sp. NBC_01813]
MAGRRREYDEDDVRIRPGRASRPRTRNRPAHGDAVDGFVVTVDRGRYGCVLADPAVPDPETGAPPVVTAMRARELGRRAVVVGDRVGLVGDVTGDPGSLARIVRIDERVSVLRRTADDDDTTPEGRLERIVVANADQLVIVSALADPPPRTGFIDRCLVAAYDAGIAPVLCLTKADLASPEQVIDYYRDLDLEFVLCRPGSDLADLRQRLAGRLSVLVGHSGVGKSTLVNRLVPEALRAVGTVSAIGRGRHTSSSAVVLRLPRVMVDGDPGWIVDTPGVRSFGLAHVSAESLLHGFADLVEGSVDCPPGCEHTGEAEQCRLAGWVAAGNADGRRLASYRRLLDSRGGDAEPGRGTARE